MNPRLSKFLYIVSIFFCGKQKNEKINYHSFVFEISVLIFNLKIRLNLIFMQLVYLNQRGMGLGLRLGKKKSEKTRKVIIICVNKFKKTIQ